MNIFFWFRLFDTLFCNCFLVYTLRHVLWQMGVIDKNVSSSCISVHSLSYTSSWRCSTACLNAPKPFAVKLRLCSVVLWQIIHLVKSVSLDNCLFITNTGSISISIYRSYSILVIFTRPTYSWVLTILWQHHRSRNEINEITQTRVSLLLALHFWYEYVDNCLNKFSILD